MFYLLSMIIEKEIELLKKRVEVLENLEVEKKQADRELANALKRMAENDRKS